MALNGHAGAVTRPLSRDQRTHSANNLVVSVPRKELAFKDKAEVFSIAGSVEIWDCRQNPVPNSKVDFVLKDVGFGVKTKVPQVVTWPGDPIKNTLLTEPFDAALPVNLVRANESDLRNRIRESNIKTLNEPHVRDFVEPTDALAGL